MSSEIIKVLEYLGEKIGITIDWTSENMMPYVQQLCEKFIKWETGTSIVNCIVYCIGILACIIVSIIIVNKIRSSDLDSFDKGTVYFILVLPILIGFFAGDSLIKEIMNIIEVQTFPEKAIYEWVTCYIESQR